MVNVPNLGDPRTRARLADAQRLSNFLRSANDSAIDTSQAMPSQDHAQRQHRSRSDSAPPKPLPLLAFMSFPPMDVVGLRQKWAKIIANVPDAKRSSDHLAWLDKDDRAFVLLKYEDLKGAMSGTASGLETLSGLGTGPTASKQVIKETDGCSTQGQDATKLQYRSGMPIKEGDVVIRLREDPVAWLPAYKQDEYDIYDGPWIVCQVSENGSWKVNNWKNYSRTLADNGTRPLCAHCVSAGLNAGLAQGQQESVCKCHVMVKLNFPEGTKGNPWTETNRLLQLQLPVAKKALVEGTATTSSEVITQSNTVFQLVQGVVVAVHPVVSVDAYGGGMKPMVEKLRGKRLHRVKNGGGGGSDLSDSWIKRYISRAPELEAGEYLVAEYLVHWAGWPSEDDSWVTAQSIPQPFKDEYKNMTDPHRGWDEKTFTEAPNILGQALITPVRSEPLVISSAAEELRMAACMSAARKRERPSSSPHQRDQTASDEISFKRRRVHKS